MEIVVTQEFIIIDGLKVDPETGEVLGVETPPEFMVQDDESAKWVLRKIGKAEAAVTAIDADPDVIWAKAILDNANAIQKRAQARLEYLHQRFDEELGFYAKYQLDGKTKTWKTPVGSVAFRTVKGGLRVVDKDKALVWAKENTPTAIKVSEEFQISKLSDIGRALAEADAHASTSAFEIKPDVDKITVTGGAC